MSRECVRPPPVVVTRDEGHLGGGGRGLLSARLNLQLGASLAVVRAAQATRAQTPKPHVKTQHRDKN